MQKRIIVLKITFEEGVSEDTPGAAEMRQQMEDDLNDAGFSESKVEVFEGEVLHSIDGTIYTRGGDPS